MSELESIYILKHALNEGRAEVFYVGRSNNPKDREKQHHYSSKKGHEDKYIYIRDIEKEGIDWWSETVTTIDPERGLPQDHERFYVIHYARMGCPLTNMKHGDIQSSREIQSQINNSNIKTIDDVINYRLSQEKLKSSKLLLKKIKSSEKEKTKEKRKANKELFETRKQNYELLKKSIGSTELSIAVSEYELFEFDTYLCFTKYTKGWSFKVEERLELPSRWMDIPQSVIPMTKPIRKIDLDKRELKGELNSEEQTDAENNKAAFQRGYKIVLNQKEITRWLLLFSHGCILNESPYKQFKKWQEDNVGTVHDFLKDNDKHRYLDKIKQTHIDNINNKNLSVDMNRHLPVTTVEDSGFRDYGGDLDIIEYQRKMALIWFCYRNNGIENFAKLVNKPVASIVPYVSFENSVPITSKLARAIEKRLDLSVESMDKNRDYMMTTTTTE